MSKQNEQAAKAEFNEVQDGGADPGARAIVSKVPIAGSKTSSLCPGSVAPPEITTRPSACSVAV